MSAWHSQPQKDKTCLLAQALNIEHELTNNLAPGREVGGNYWAVWPRVMLNGKAPHENSQLLGERKMAAGTNQSDDWREG